jgi:hypothetical protein
MLMADQIADRLVTLCRVGQFEKAQTELFADDAVSIEPEPVSMRVAQGLAAIREKGSQFMRTVKRVHRIEVSDPLVAGDCFTISTAIDSTFVGQGRVKTEKIYVYQARDGKIVSEQFIYATGG